MLVGFEFKIYLKTRMHSSRIRTVRNSSRLLPGRGVSPPGGVSAPGWSLLTGGVLPGGVCSGGVLPGGGYLLLGGVVVSQHALR